MTTLRPWLLAASLLCGLPAGAATRYVDDGNCPGPGTGTTGDPYCSIQLALNAANLTGDTIIVRPGTYSECLDATPKSVVLQADSNDPSIHILDGFACSGVSTLTIGDGSTVDGFWMSGGGEGAIFALNGITLTNNIITTNSAQGAGGGIFLDTDPSLVAGPATIQITIQGNDIENNTTDREGGGIWMSANASATVDVVALITGNTISGNHSSAVGGGIGLLTHAAQGGSVAVTIDGNIFQSNTVDSPPLSDADGYGGAIWMSTSGPGDESVTITGNTIGPALGVDNDTLRNTATRNGGGISAWVFASDTSHHALSVESNKVRRNTADLDAGGVEILVVAEGLDAAGTPPGRYSVLMNDNDIDGNSCGVFGAGFVADIESFDSPSRRNPTDLVKNRITNNVAGLAGGGGDTRCFALGGPLTFCGVAFRHNTVTGNSAPNSDPNTIGFGGGVTLYAEAEGAGIARIDATDNTVTGNDAYVGGAGIDLEAITTELASGTGTAVIEIARSRIENNHCTPGSTESCGWGIGFPDHFDDPPVLQFRLRSSDVTPNEGGGVESTLASHRTDVCMPATTSAALLFPGIDSDEDVDGVDLLRMATSFAASSGAIHYNPLTDLNGDTVVDGNDLSILGASFGDTCP